MSPAALVLLDTFVSLCVPWCFSLIFAVTEGLFRGSAVEPAFELLDLEAVWLKLISHRSQQRMKMLSTCWAGEYSLVKGCPQPLPPVPPIVVCS